MDTNKIDNKPIVSLQRSKTSSITSSKAQDSVVSFQVLHNSSIKGTTQELLLHDAIINNDIEAVKKLLETNVLIDFKSHMERTPCHLAAMHGHAEVLSLLIHAKCDVESIDKFGMSPLLVAAWYGHKGTVKVLIENGCNCRTANKRGQSVLHCATKGGHEEIVEYLLKHVDRLDINAVDKSKQSALHIAVINNDIDIVKNLIETGVDTSIKDKNNRTAAHWAAINGNDEILDVLLPSSSSNLNEREEEGRTLLHLGAENNHQAIIKTLLKYNCDILATDSKGRTALHTASALGHTDVINALLQSNSSGINAKDKRGNTPLHLALLGNHLEVVQILVENGAHVNATNSVCQRQQTPLHLAAEQGFTQLAEILVAHGADFSLPEKSGRTPLYIAARGSFVAIVDMLIKAEREKHSLSGKCSRNSSIERHISIESNDTQDTYSCDHNTGEYTNELYLQKVREMLWFVSRNYLTQQDWKRMARHWGFSEEHIKAIEHQYVGKTSYKEHSFRMMLIWLHGLPPCVNPLCELLDTLNAIDKKDTAEKVRKKIEEGNFFTNRNRRRCHCLPSSASHLCGFCNIF